MGKGFRYRNFAYFIHYREALTNTDVTAGLPSGVPERKWLPLLVELGRHGEHCHQLRAPEGFSCIVRTSLLIPPGVGLNHPSFAFHRDAGRSLAA